VPSHPPRYPQGEHRGPTTKAVTGMANEPRPEADISQLAHVQFLTVAEVAAMMRVSKMTVYRLVHGGELPAARVGRSFRVPKRAVEDYLRSAYFDAG
jgi:excisionase family DNA binding protein